MGYCYDTRGRLCCDSCGEAPAIKIPCPHGYCPATALCKTCRNSAEIRRKSAEYHEKYCRPAHAAYVRRQQEREARLKTGAFLRTAALNHHYSDGTMVKVCFENQHSETRCYFMSPETYGSFPLLHDVTPQDYAEHGAVVPAKTNDLHDPR